MTRPQHQRAFAVTVAWTLLLLFLGSVVHATESSLACPDWPTCYGTMVPVMVGGVFWEHLHRLVAGGLILMWGLATFLAWREGAGRQVLRWCAAGVALLLVQAVFGGLTVLYRLPDAVSTTHLGLAFLFLVLATVLAESGRPEPAAPGDAGLTAPAAAAAGLVFLQSLLGAWVRHADAGTACGLDGFLCLDYPGLPPASDPLALLHFTHRVIGVVTALAVVGVAVLAFRRATGPRVRTLAAWAGALVAAQVALGFLSAWTGLAVLPVSLHTLVAALTLAALAALTARSRVGPGSERPASAAARVAA